MALYLDFPLPSTRPTTPVVPRTAIWSDPFDSALIILPLAAGLAAAGAALSEPRLFPLLLLADLWLLGYHHVVATYTRLAFAPAALRQNRVMAVDLLLVVTAVTLALAFTVGAWVVATAFLYLQWFHYMRQGYGIARMFFRVTPEGRKAGSRDLITDLVIYLVPVYAIAARSATLGDVFLGLPTRALVLPGEVIRMLGVAAALALGVWIVRTGVAAVRGTLDAHYACFVLSHVAIFGAGYLLIADANTGWLAINVWHNFQYVLVVWMVNGKRFAGGIEPAARLISTISQPGRTAAYFLTCLAISTAIYLVLDRFVAAVGGGLAVTVGIYMGINFHHYIVDAFIWKRRRVAPQPA